MPQNDSFFLLKFWQPIMFILGLGAVGVKNHVDTKAVKNAVFNKEGEVRLISKRDCAKCSENQLKREGGRDRELQNIHESIADLNKTVSNMPIEICEHLKTMGHLK